MLLLFRPPFINGRPQDSDSVFWKKKPLTPVFEEFSPVFLFASFLKRSHQGSPGECWTIVGPPLGHRWPTAGPKNIFGDMGLNIQNFSVCFPNNTVTVFISHIFQNVQIGKNVYLH